MQTVEVFLNRFPLRPLEEEEASPWLLQVQLDPPPEPEATYALLGRLARQVGPMVARFGTGLVSPSLPEGLALEGEVAGSRGSHAYRLLPQGRHPLDPARPGDREALNALARRRLELGLQQAFPKGYRVEGRRLLGLKPLREGPGWRLLRGAELDLMVDPEGRWLLEVDLVHRLEATLDLEGWLAQGHPLPARARNAYGGGYRGVWEVVRLGEEAPEEVLLENGLSLLAYHRQKGHWEGRSPGRVVWVRDPRRAKETPHLTGLLVPVLTLEELEEPLALQIPPEPRRKDAEQVARVVAQRLFGLPEARPLRVQARRLPQAQLRAHGGKRAGKPADALRVGALGAREATVALLRLDGGQGWPPPLLEALKGVARASGVSMRFLIGQTPPPERELAFRQALEGIRAQGAEALLVLTPPLSPERRNRLKALALQEGLPTQLLNTPLGPGDRHRMASALLGPLAKLAWPVVALEGRAVGFDAGGRDTLRFGGAACATTGDGSFLGWALPEAQVGERIPERVAWDLLAN
ncbi:argonaute PAZ domain-containing protein, partial [Thermus sp.]|uniref:argonaute PAZ domain-containing protein n=1 Tax=Thermus sp. TaxID=275 RepID=UPI0025EBC017